jgi:nicotinamide-nucleotide amidase
MSMHEHAETERDGDQATQMHQPSMTAEIICVGTELLLGQVVNTNAAYLGARLADLGIGVYRNTVVGDNHARLMAALAAAANSCNLVVLSGGLGPTDDDITRKVVADYLELPLQESQSAVRDIEAFLSHFSIEMNEKNRKQGFFPEGSVVIPNANGTAPGCLVDKDGVAYLLLPGPPAELQTMFEREVEPLLRGRSGTRFESRVIRISGIGEAQLEAAIQDFVDSQLNPTVAVYAGIGEASVRLTAAGVDRPDVAAALDSLHGTVKERLGHHVYGGEDDSLEKVVLRELESLGLRLAVAESCTGGALAARLISVPGASRVLEEGVVVYSDESKIRRLSVDANTIEEFGAVSEEVVSAMATGVAEGAGVDVGVALSGVAGPDGGTEEKPVGTVFIAVFLHGNITVRRYRLPGDREKVQRFSVTFALELLRRSLLAEAVS